MPWLLASPGHQHSWYWLCREGFVLREKGFQLPVPCQCEGNFKYMFIFLLNYLARKELTRMCGFSDLFTYCYSYGSAFRCRRHYVFGLSVCPSVRPKPEIPSFDLYMGPLVHSTNRDRFTACPSSVCPSVRPERFQGICQRMLGGNGLKFCMLMYLDHLQNWLDYGHGLLIFLLLAPLWLSETGRIRGFWAFPGERM